MLMTEKMRNPDIADSTYNMIVVFTFVCMDEQMIDSLESKQDACISPQFKQHPIGNLREYVLLKVLRWSKLLINKEILRDFSSFSYILKLPHALSLSLFIYTYLYTYVCVLW